MEHIQSRTAFTEFTGELGPNDIKLQLTDTFAYKLGLSNIDVSLCSLFIVDSSRGSAQISMEVTIIPYLYILLNLFQSFKW